MTSSLLATRRFAPLFWCQFFSAFNDNFLKNALVFLILFKWAGPNSAALIALAPAVLIFPFFILSAIGGEVADRFDKSVVASRLKLVEIAVAAIAMAGFLYDSPALLFTALFLIVVGITSKNGGPASFAGLMMAFALACWISALFIPRTGEAAPHLVIDFNIARSTWTLLRDLRRESRLWWGGMVVSWFWLDGVVVTTLLAPLIQTALGGDEGVINAYLAVFSVAVAVGSGLAAWLASGRIVLIPTVFGAVLLAVFAIDLGWLTAGMVAGGQGRGIAEVFSGGAGIHVAIDLAGLAIGGGLFIVPSFAAVQAWA